MTLSTVEGKLTYAAGRIIGEVRDDERVSDNLELSSPTASFLPKGVGLN